MTKNSIPHTSHRTWHGLSHTPEYRIWQDILRRCRNPNRGDYHHYGGRGIEVCSRWQEFTNFYNDMGKRPSSKHTIDRIDNDGDYTPENCTWSTMKEQSNNRSSNVLLTFNGETLNVTQWAEKTGIYVWTLRSRIQLGWTAERALTEPVKKRGW